MKSPGFLLLDILLAVAITGLVLTGGTILLLRTQAYESSLLAVRAARYENQDRAYVWSREQSIHTAPTGGWREGENLSLLTPCIGVGTFQTMQSDGARSVSDLFHHLVVDRGESDRLGVDCTTFALAGLRAVLVSLLALGPRVQVHGVDCVVRNGTTYVFAGGTSTQVADPDLFILDASEPSAPQVISTLDVGAGIFALDAYASVLFAGRDAAVSQLALIDASDLRHPSVVSQQTLTGVTGSFPEARAVTAYDAAAYVGTYETAGPEFHVFSFSDAPALRSISTLAVQHSLRAFLPYQISGELPHRQLLFGASSADTEELLVLDVTDPLHPARVAAVNLPGTGNATALALAGTELLVGRQQVAGQSTLDVVDVRNPTQPTLLSSVPALLRSGSVVHGLLYSNQHLFFTTTDVAKPLGSCAYEAGRISGCSFVTGYPDPGRIDACGGYLFVPTQHALAIVKPE